MLEPRLENGQRSRARFWTRVALRLAVWGSMAVICGSAFLLHSCLQLSPEAYQGLHDSDSWIPLDVLSEEARGFADAYYPNSEYRLGRIRNQRDFSWPDPYNLFSGWLYRMTMSRDDILQLVLSNCTKASSVKGPLQLEDLLELSYGDPQWKSSHLKQMLRRGSITQKRYQEGQDFLSKLE